MTAPPPRHTPDPWQVITDLASVLYRGGQDARDVRREALGILWRNGITIGGDGAQAQPAPESAGGQWTVAELAAALDSFCAWFTVVGGGARVQGQLLGADADEFARALHAGLESARARRQ